MMTEQIVITETEKKQDILSWWIGKIGKEEYMRIIYLLQEEANLSFKEARAWLLPHQFVKRLAALWGCSEENVYKLRRKAIDKIEMTEVMGKIPAAYYHIL